jgi:hypothetical protein
MKCIFPILVLLSLAGCATGIGGKDRMNGATIFVYREAGGVNGPYPKAVLLDGRAAGKLTANGFLEIAVTPGKHVISSPAANPASVTLIAEKGKSYYVSQEIIPTMPVFHVLLNRVNDTLGSQSVARARRVY